MRPALKLAGLVITGGCLVLLAELVTAWLWWHRNFT